MIEGKLKIYRKEFEGDSEISIEYFAGKFDKGITDFLNNKAFWHEVLNIFHS